MQQFRQKYLPICLLLLFSAGLFFIKIQDGQPWGDDFAQYIKEAQNIATGKPFYQSNYIFNKSDPIYAPPQYPPGFPLLLAPVIKLFGLSFRAMCYFNSVITACLLFALYVYFRKFAGIVASVCLSVLIVYNAYMLLMKGNILADIPCLLFITLYFTFRRSATFPANRIIILVLLAVMAILIRSQAIFLLAAEGLFFIFSSAKAYIKTKKIKVQQVLAIPSLYIIAGVPMVIFVLNHSIFYSPYNINSFYGDFVQTALNDGLLERAKMNFSYLLQVITAYFHYEHSNGLLQLAESFIEYTGLILGILGFIINISKRLAVEDFFFIIICALIIYYPFHDPRYFMPALPLLFYYCYTVLNLIATAIPGINKQVVAIALTVIYLLTGYHYFEEVVNEVPTDYIPKQKDLIAFRYISQHVDDSDLIVFIRPRALTLFTDKRSIVFSMQISPEMNKKVFDGMHAKYMLVIDGMNDNYLKTYLNGVQHPIDSSKISDGYTLYTLR